MLRRYILAFLLALASGSGTPVAYADSVSEYELKAALLFRFAQFIDWPAPVKDTFNICIYGKNPFGSALLSLNGKKVQQVPVAVKYPHTPNEIQDCRMLFLDQTDAKRLSVPVAGLPILTISDDPGAWDESVMVVFIAEPNRVAFSVNRSAAQSVGIDFRAQMLQLAYSLR